MAADDLLLTRAEVAERLHVSVQTVRRLAESRHLAEVQVSARAVRVRAASVDRLIREGLPRRRWVREFPGRARRVTVLAALSGIERESPARAGRRGGHRDPADIKVHWK